MTASARVDVFVSYRHREPTATWVRTDLAAALTDAGLTSIIDVVDFAPGGVIVEEMERSAVRARVTLAVVDESYRDSGFTDFERAVSPTVVAVVLADVTPDRLPPNRLTVDVRDTRDARVVVDAVRTLVKRVFILDADADEGWVEGVLLPGLDQAGVAAEHAGGIEDGLTWSAEVERRIMWADRVVVVLSGAYLRDLSATVDQIVSHAEAVEHVQKLLPVQREQGLVVPVRLSARKIIDASRAELWDATVEQICSALGITAPVPLAPPPCPYPGMVPYREDQEDTFFGRDAEVAEVLADLHSRRVAAVIGPSGSGKSSLVLAGLVPRLRREGIDGTPFAVEVMRPGSSAESTLAEAIARLDASGTGARLLVVDQLEELFVGPAEHVEPFCTALTAAHAADRSLHVVVTMRADHYPGLMSSALWGLVAPSRCEVVPLRGTALRQAIRQPARQRRVVVDEALVERLTAEAEGQPGLLPFLQETMRLLWEGMIWRLLSLDSYERVGLDPEEQAVLQAIQRQAESAFQAAVVGDRERERVVRSMLLRLVQFGEGTPDGRRQVTLDELAASVPDPPVFRSTYDTLVEYRILTPGSLRSGSGVDEHEVAVVDLCHEAVMHGWSRLADWIAGGRAVELHRRRWLQRATDWQDGRGAVLGGADLVTAEAWLRDADSGSLGVDPLVRRYVAESRTRAEHARRRRRLALVAVTTIATVVALVFALLARSAVRARTRAENEGDKRVATELRTTAAAYRGGLPLRALLVRAADRIEPSPLSAIEMLVTVEAQPPVVRRIDSLRHNVGFEAVAAVDDRLVVGDGKGAVTVFSASSGAALGTTDVGHGVLTIARQPGATLVAIGGGDSVASGDDFVGSHGGVDLVDVADAALARRPLPLDGDAPVSTAVFDGGLLYVGSWDGTIRVFDVHDPGAPHLIRQLSIPPAADPACAQSDRKVRSLAIDDGHRWLAAGSNNCLVALWNLGSFGEPGVLTGHTSKVRAIAFVPGTADLVTTGDDRSIRSWSLDTDPPAASVLVEHADEQRVVALCVAPDGSAVVTAGRDHRVRRWLRTGNKLVADPTPYEAHTTTVRAVLCTAADEFVSVGGDGVVVWSASGVLKTGRNLAARADAASINAVALRPSTSGSAAEVAVADASGVAVHSGARRGAVLVETPDLLPTAVSYDRGGARLVVGGIAPTGGDAVVVVYDATTLEQQAPPQRMVGGGAVHSLAVAGDGTIAVGLRGGRVELIENDRQTEMTVATERTVISLTFGPHGELLMGDDGGTLLCRAHGQAKAASIELGRPITGLATGSDGTVIASTTDGAVIVAGAALATSSATCTPSDWQQTSLPMLHDSIVSIDVTADATMLAAAGSDGTIDIWDVRRTRLLGSLRLGSGSELGRLVRIDPTGTRLVVAGLSTVTEFDVEREPLRAALCALAGRNLTSDERATFLPEARYQEKARCEP